MADIKILVACHKPSELPQNELFLPIQVGAALATRTLPITQDNTGDNISDKNPTYCELTAQYWAWKNLQADYYGLCHYRRFLCFKPGSAQRDRRNQIQAGVLDQFNIERFGLDDADLMRRTIEQYDLVIGEEQTVSRLYTPRGSKNTAYAHWAAHDRALIMKSDLDQMLQTLSEVAPEVGQAAREYLASKYFLGFNCFVMKRELFQQLCSIEFEVLSRLEQTVDLSHYCQQLTRIYGFMGEIISSSFFYYLQQTGKYRIKHVPILYFNYTDPLENYAPLAPASAKQIPIIFDYADGDPINFVAPWRSFLDHIDPKYQYDVLLLADFTPEAFQALQDMAHDCSNVSLRLLAAEPLRELLADKYRLSDIFTEKQKQKYNPEDDNLHTPVLPFLPFILPQYQRALIFDRYTLFCDSIAPLWKQHYRTDKLVAAPPDVHLQAQLNDIYYETAARHLAPLMKDPYQYFSTNAFIWNFELYRQTVTEQQIRSLYYLPAEHRLRPKDEILNLLCEGQVESVDLRWNTWFETNPHLTYQLPYAPFDLYKQLLAARQHPGIIAYMPHDAWEPVFTPLTARFWDAARRTPFYELYLQHGTDLTLYRSKNPPRDLLGQVFPVDGNLRSHLTKLFPYGSKRNQAIKRALHALRLR